MKKTATILAVLLLTLTSNLFSQRDVSLDWKLHDIGEIRQLITNTGALWRSAVGDAYPGLIYCEFPRSSFEEHIGEGGIWIGAISGNDTLVSVTTGWGSSVEFYPSTEPWDTIYSVERDDTVDIPYWPGYVGLADQDFVCRYGDYHILTQSNHKPLYIDVIQASHAWGGAPLDQMIVYDFYVLPNKNTLEDMYIAYWLDGNVGYRGTTWDFALDDYTRYFSEHYMGVSLDAPGGADGTAISPIGMMMIPPEGVNPDTLNWTFYWYPGQGGGSPSSIDAERYMEMAQGVILEDQIEAIGSQFIVSFGPFTVSPGDTVHFRVAQILGDGEEKFWKNVGLMDWLVEQDFKVPSPPPIPPLRIEEQSGQVTLNWEPQPGDVDPETYTDPYRADSSQQPFEGYKVYKSTKSASGPWTLLAEFDLIDGMGSDVGIQRSYTDVGLLNNLQYYYSVTSFSKEDTVVEFPPQESSIFKNATEVVPGTPPPSNVGEVAVVPNPYRGDIAYYNYDPPWEKPDETRDLWMEQDRRIQFINLPAECEIKIYTLSGDLLATLNHSNPQRGYEDWNLTSDVGQAVASGIYLFTVEDRKTGDVQVGKFVIIK